MCEQMKAATTMGDFQREHEVQRAKEREVSERHKYTCKYPFTHTEMKRVVC
jgi:hypothetical protein